MHLTILALGDIVGRAGRRIVLDRLPELRRAVGADLVIANAENMADGSGLIPRHVEAIREAGVDAVTTGDHVYRRKQILSLLESSSAIVRPANYPPEAAGTGHAVLEAEGVRVGLFNLQGRVFMDAVECPFRTADRVVEELDGCGVVVCDMHAEATSETLAMGRHLDGRTALVFGTHTHVQTADEQVLDGGTAYITDLGMTGPHEGIIGREAEPVLKKFITHMPHRFTVASGDPRISGILCRVDAVANRGLAIQRISLGEDDDLPEPWDGTEATAP